MEYAEFTSSLSQDQPPASISPVLASLWWDGKGNWHQSHEVAQEIHDQNGSLIHAYLHRKEGDISNARYWYSMAGSREPKLSLQEEWEELVKRFLK